MCVCVSLGGVDGSFECLCLLHVEEGGQGGMMRGGNGGRLLHKDTAVVLTPLEVIPQCGHDLAHHHLIRILADEAEHKHAVLPQIVFTKRAEQLLVKLFATEPIHELQVLFEETYAIPGQRVPDPQKEAVYGGACDVDEPEPNEYENLLVEQVDGQRALHHVVVYVVAEEAHLEMAHGDAREPGRLDHLRRLALRRTEQVPYDLDAEQAVFIAQEFVEQKELRDDVADEQELGEQVDGEQVVALPLAEYDAAEFAEKFGGARERPRVHLALHL